MAKKVLILALSLSIIEQHEKNFRSSLSTLDVGLIKPKTISRSCPFKAVRRCPFFIYPLD
jgi:hypothetical protein